ncbi:MAG TPA: GNAT family N-acetyltransferase, partial [Minicystis sp.]|nr:GNAT family N-acetyltransferase [Minicystis sp.]
GLVRAARGGYSSLLGASTRTQLRRAQRAYGPLSVEVAREPNHATDVYEELAELHARRWRARGEPGAFARPSFDRFHRALVAARLPHGEIQLVRVRAQNKTIACLYNFVSGGRVLFYQSGVALSDDPHEKPGYVAHAEAVERNAAEGRRIYDFLGGDLHYKERLATGSAPLTWARVQRPLARFVAEEQLRTCKRALVGFVDRARARIAPGPAH